MRKDRDGYNEYMRGYLNDRYAHTKKEVVAFLGGKCVICGTTSNLEIDHIDRSNKSFDVSKLWSKNKNDYLTEIKKCQLLCKNHHKEKTSKERGVEHGGGLTGKRGCPCDLCRSRKSEYMKEYNKQRSNKLS